VLVTEVSGWEKWLHMAYQSLMESAEISAPGTKKNDFSPEKCISPIGKRPFLH
jgi:hypothetical protein